MRLVPTRVLRSDKLEVPGARKTIKKEHTIINALAWAATLVGSVISTDQIDSLLRESHHCKVERDALDRVSFDLDLALSPALSTMWCLSLALDKQRGIR